MTPARPTDELLLEAFQYVSGEMSAAEIHAFESRLADDFAAQSAVADVVLLTQCVGDAAALPMIPSVARPSALPRRRGWVAVAACLSVGAAAVVGWFRGDDSTQVARDDAKSRRILTVWSELQSDDAVSNAEELATDLTVAAADDDAVPDWMFTALAGAAEMSDAALPVLDDPATDSTDEES